MSHLYFDTNADSPILPEAWSAYRRGASCVGNPSSAHLLGRESKDSLFAAEARLKQLLNAYNYDVYWTSGGTESDALVLQGTATKRIAVGAAEHAAVLENSDGAQLIPMGTDGVYDISDLALNESVSTLVCLALANSETGVVQPLSHFVSDLRSRGDIWLHCDGVQAVGRLAVDLESLDVDSFALAAHKFGGVPGIGALLVKQGNQLTPQLRGGGQQAGLRPGTLQLAGPMAMVAALEAWSDEHRSRLGELRDKLETNASQIPGVSVVAQESDRLPNTSSLKISGCSGDALLMALDIEGFSISTGSACSSGAIEPSKTLLAMGMSPTEASEVIRISLGFEHTLEDVVAFTNALMTIVERARLFR